MMHSSAAIRRAHVGASVAVTGGLVALLWRAMDADVTHPALLALVLTLFALNTYMLVSAAGIALIGMTRTDKTGALPVPAPANDRCAVLWLVCGEAPEPLALRIGEFLRDIDSLGGSVPPQVFVLSDTQTADGRVREQAALAPVADRIIYRNRPHPDGRKPGNLHDWLSTHGADYDTMLVLDADSGFSAARLNAMRARMADDASLGLIQSAVRLRPSHTRFGKMQRLSARLSGPVFARGLERLSGESGNFWGHNALIRVSAFQQVTPLPVLSGPPPLGGLILSHDFIEAAFLRRAGWKVVIEPVGRGSFEDAPDTLGVHLRRDRRWAQGNLQHLRLVGARGLHMTSRLHLIAGIQSYLSAPIWLALVVLTGSGAVHATAGVLLPLFGVLAALLVPKLMGLRARGPLPRHYWRRRVVIRALLAELALTTVFAPISMVRRTGFVLAVFLGRATAWVPSGQGAVGRGPSGLAERAVGLGILVAVMTPQWVIGTASAAFMSGALVLPVVLPLLFAPAIYRWFDQSVQRNAVAEYYDTSTRRFLATGGSGRALAIHRPLWANGVQTDEQAASHINALIAQAAEAALGHTPARVHDLGCGVGGTLFHLAQHWPDAALCGVTISAEQVAIARNHATARGLEERCLFVRSDFTLPMTLPPADLVIAIESHVHAPDAGAFLTAARRHLRPDGVLVIVDDLLAAPEAELTAAQRLRVAAFKRGWRLGHVPARDALVAQAATLGFAPVGTTDLTPLLRLNRWRDLALRAVGPVADAFGLSRLPLFGNMIGGNALTESYRAGVMRYSMVLLRRTDAAARALPAAQTGLSA
jgi:membrane glycosyltransferase/cyclopropane fatty-acyl-phospholipid synthase-like methyltransferase